MGVFGEVVVEVDGVAPRWVVAGGGNVDVSGLATKDELAGKADKSELPDVSGLATKAEIPDVSGLASKAELATKADKSAIPDVSGLATKSELATKADKTELATKADRAELPDVSGLATKQELAGKADKSAIPDVSGLATKVEHGLLVARVDENSRDIRELQESKTANAEGHGTDWINKYYEDYIKTHWPAYAPEYGGGTPPPYRWYWAWISEHDESNETFTVLDVGNSPMQFFEDMMVHPTTPDTGGTWVEEGEIFVCVSPLWADIQFHGYLLGKKPQIILNVESTPWLKGGHGAGFVVARNDDNPTWVKVYDAVATYMDWDTSLSGEDINNFVIRFYDKRLANSESLDKVGNRLTGSIRVYPNVKPVDTTTA